MSLPFETESPRVVLQYYVYRAVGNPGFIQPIYVLYLLFHDLSFAQIGVIGAVQSIIVVGGEVPTGYVGDRIGRRNSLVVAQLLFIASTVAFIVGSDVVVLTVAFALISFGGTFISGSADAWLYDILDEHLDGDEFTHVRGRGGAIGQWVMAATMIGGGVMYGLDPVVPFYALLVMRVVTLGVVLSLPKNAAYSDDEARKESAGQDDDTLTSIDALPIIRNRLASRELRAFVAFMALFFAVSATTSAYVQPIAQETLRNAIGPLLDAYNVTEAASLGLLYASFTVVSAIASDYAGDLRDAVGTRTAILGITAIAGVLFVAPAIVPILSFPMFFAMRGSRSLLSPIVGQYLNDHVESVGRATVLSAVSMVYALTRIPFSLGSGVFADYTSPLFAVAAMGATFLLAGSAIVALTTIFHETNVSTPADTPSSE